MAKPKTVDEYIQQSPVESQAKLREMRAILREAAPDAEEGLKWGNPVFSHHRILFAYAGYKDHINFALNPPAVRAFEKELKDYKTGKGSISFPLDKPLPKPLIKKIARFRVKDLKENDAKWM